jgi:hypothetical protein
LRTRGHHVLHGGRLASVVGVKRPRRCQQLHAGCVGRRLGALFHLDKEGVGFGLGDQPDDDLFILSRGGLHGGE